MRVRVDTMCGSIYVFLVFYFFFFVRRKKGIDGGTECKQTEQRVERQTGRGERSRESKREWREWREEGQRSNSADKNTCIEDIELIHIIQNIKPNHSKCKGEEKKKKGKREDAA